MAVTRTPRAARNPYFGALAATFVSVGAEASNARLVTVQITNRGADAAERTPFVAYLSSDANGDVLHATAPDGGWAVGTDGSLFPITASKMAQCLSEADGDFDVNITHAAGAYTCYVNVLVGGRKFTSGAVTFA